MNKITWVVSDLDGTLLNDEKAISKTNQLAIKTLNAQNIKFGIVSGRPVETIFESLSTWNIKEYVEFIIGMNGGTYFDITTNQKQIFHPLSKETVLEIYEHFKDMDVCFQIIQGAYRYTNRSTPESIAYTKLCGEQEVEVDLIQYIESHPVQKFMMYVQEENMPSVLERASTFSNQTCLATQTTPNMLEYTDIRIHKGFGLKKASELLNLDLLNCLAFGDEANDIEMFKSAHTSICMSNGTPVAKNHATYVSEYTNNEDGVAHFIFEQLLNEEMPYE